MTIIIRRFMLIFNRLFVFADDDIVADFVLPMCRVQCQNNGEGKGFLDHVVTWWSPQSAPL